MNKPGLKLLLIFIGFLVLREFVRFFIVYDLLQMNFLVKEFIMAVVFIPVFIVFAIYAWRIYKREGKWDWYYGVVMALSVLFILRILSINSYLVLNPELFELPQ